MKTYEQLASRLRSSSVQLIGGRGGGSGVVWDDQGTIVSNAHVVRGREADVVFASGERVRATVVRQDEDADLAVLRTRPGLAPPATLGDSDKLRPGEMVIAVGNPLGFTGAVSAGVIHAIAPLPLGPRRDWVQADVRLAPGNSGGMLANSAGEVIGINTMVMSGLGLAVPSNEAGRFALGEAAQAVRLGVEMVPVPQGLVVVRIERGSLAERANMVLGDVIRCSAAELRTLLEAVRTRGEVEIPVLHGGAEKRVRVQLAQEAKAA